MLRSLLPPRRLAAAFLTASSFCLSTSAIQAEEPSAEPSAEAVPAEIAPSEATPAPKPAVGAPANLAPCDTDNGQAGGGGLGFHHAHVSPPTQWGYGRPDLFYDFYVPGANCGVPAHLYTSPGQVPAIAGHTYITYQPFMPHEQLYPHHRTYHRTYDEGRGISRAHVSWYCPPVRHVAQQFYFNKIRLAR